MGHSDAGGPLPRAFGREERLLCAHPRVPELLCLPGFVSNRILMPFINEAAYALLEGVAEPEAIDTVATTRDSRIRWARWRSPT